LQIATIRDDSDAGTTITTTLKGRLIGMDFDWQSINASGSFAERDYVTNKLSTWMPILEPLRDTPLSVLEIGSMEGRSSFSLPATCLRPSSPASIPSTNGRKGSTGI
jgi:hypothetical protein